MVDGEWKIVYTMQAQKDAKTAAENNLKTKIVHLIRILRADPFQNPPPYRKLRGDLKGAYSRRINYQHRLVYEVHEDIHAVKILRMWTHYE